MKRFLFLLFVLPIVFFAQEINWNLMGSGARALGMGGAFIGVADDASSIIWNPAGIAQLIRPEVSICGSFKNENWETEEGWYDYSNSHFSLDFGSLVYPISLSGMRFVISFAYHSILERYYEYSDTTEETWGTYTMYEQLSKPFAALTPAFGFNLGPLLAGASFDIWKFGPEYYWYENTEGPDINLTYEYREKNSPTSLGINIGGLYVDPNFRFGGLFRLPHTVKQKISWKKELSGDSTYKNNGEYDGTEIEFPMMFGLGGSFILLNTITIAVDYEIRPYSKMTFNGQEDTSTYDCNQLRAGIEFMFNIEKIALPLRLGYMTDPRTYGDEKGQVIGHNFTFGAGIVLDRVSFDFGGNFGVSKEKYHGMTEPGTYTKFNLLLTTTVRL